MRLATFNVENMFERAKAMNFATWAEGRPILDDFAQLNNLIQNEVYTDAVKARLLEIMQRHKGLLSNKQSRYLVLREVRGEFLRKPRDKPAVITAAGRADWIGWFDLAKEPVTEAACTNIARVIDLVNADVLAVVEAENRILLKDFNEAVLPKVTPRAYEHVMLIDGNDKRGIDVGVLTRRGFSIERLLSHVDDTDGKGVIFSRDCAEYEVHTPQGNTLLLLVNHFKSKGYGGAKASAEKRLRQARRVRAIYDTRLQAGYEFIAVLGDLNENPDQPALDPLIREGASLTDVMVHSRFIGDGRAGTHGNGNKSSKLDYILMSPALSARVIRGGIERRGVWGGKKGTLFPHLETITRFVDSASDHAALWVEADL